MHRRTTVTEIGVDDGSGGQLLAIVRVKSSWDSEDIEHDVSVLGLETDDGRMTLLPRGFALGLRDQLDIEQAAGQHVEHELAEENDQERDWDVVNDERNGY